MRVHRLILSFVLAIGFAAACGDSSDDSGGDGGSSGSSTGGTGADAGTGDASTGGTSAGGTSAGGSSAGGTSAGGSSGASAGGASGAGTGGSGACGTTQCTDCIDNDNDGLIDGSDPECIGPLDNDEATYATGIPGDNIDPCKQDCFFDGNSGSGDDKCLWELKCDPASPGAPDCPYDPNYKNCPTQQSQQCIDFCTKLTPNGCDCFGCCEVPLPGGGTTNILLAPTCTIADAADPTKCPPCTPTASCDNPCETCELCLGKSELPPECFPDAGTGGAGGAGGSGGTGGAGGSGGCPTPVCPAGQQACGLSCLAPCPAGQYCLTGCCIPIS